MCSLDTRPGPGRDGAALPITASYRGRGQQQYLWGALQHYLQLSVDNNVYKLIFFIVHTWALLAFVVLFN